MKDRVLIASDEDMQSVLIPCLGFNEVARGLAYAKSPEYLGMNGIYDPYAARIGGHKCHVPLVGSRTSDYNTNAFMPGRVMITSTKPAYRVIRRKENPRPDGAYNVAIMVNGPRLFRRLSVGRGRWTWTNGLNEGDRHCYATWAHVDGEPMPGVTVQYPHGLSFGRSGRGVLYADELVYDDHGQPKGINMTTAMIEFNILDRNPEKDDLMRVVARHHRDYSFKVDSTTLPEARIEGLDPVWQNLVSTAQRGFRATCERIPPAVEAWRIMYLDQAAKLKDYDLVEAWRSH